MFGSKQIQGNVQDQLNITIHNEPLSKQEFAMNLDIVNETDLKFRSHVYFITQKSYSAFNLIYFYKNYYESE